MSFSFLLTIPQLFDLKSPNRLRSRITTTSQALFSQVSSKVKEPMRKVLAFSILTDVQLKNYRRHDSNSIISNLSGEFCRVMLIVIQQLAKIYHRKFNTNKINKMSKFVNSTSSFKQVNGSPTNNSTSKNLWSFPKQPRFKANAPYCDKIYERESTFRKTGTSIGLGMKFDFTKDQTCSPGATKYTIDTQIDANIKKKRGYSIKVGRDDSPQKGYIPVQPLRFPGSTKYDNCKLSNGYTYTMRQKTKVQDKTMTIQPQNNYPGPGSYENPQFEGKRIASRFRSTQKYSLNQKTKRFFQQKDNNPGPGDYTEINQFSDKGHYPLSKTIGYGKRFFDKEKRQSQFGRCARVNIAPGPGSYKIPSEFGYY